jgi:tartrate dehydratase beta subunit/fumarate hydratase class I family protein
MNVAVRQSHALTLSTMRDALEHRIDELKPEGNALPYEAQRDALVWALEQLAPELA